MEIIKDSIIHGVINISIIAYGIDNIILYRQNPESISTKCVHQAISISKRQNSESNITKMWRLFRFWFFFRLLWMVYVDFFYISYQSNINDYFSWKYEYLGK